MEINRNGNYFTSWIIPLLESHKITSLILSDNMYIGHDGSQSLSTTKSKGHSSVKQCLVILIGVNSYPLKVEKMNMVWWKNLFALVYDTVIWNIDSEL